MMNSAVISFRLLYYWLFLGRDYDLRLQYLHIGGLCRHYLNCCLHYWDYWILGPSEPANQCCPCLSGVPGLACPIESILYSVTSFFHYNGIYSSLAAWNWQPFLLVNGHSHFSIYGFWRLWYFTPMLNLDSLGFSLTPLQMPLSGFVPLLFCIMLWSTITIFI